MTDRNIRLSIWLVTGALLVPPLIYWGNELDWRLDRLTPLRVFPLLGLWAFTLMWMHFAAAAYRRRRPDLDLVAYFQLTGYVVLALIILHPGLLLVEAIEKEFTVFDYAGKKNTLAVLFGMGALAVFLAYEVVHRLRERPAIQRHWQWVRIINLIAFVAVYLHGLRLGQHLQEDWLRGLWLFYGLATAVFVIDTLWWIFKDRQR